MQQRLFMWAINQKREWVNHDTTHKGCHYGNSSIARCQLGEHFGQSHLARYMLYWTIGMQKLCQLQLFLLPSQHRNPITHSLVKGVSHWLQVALHQVHHAQYTIVKASHNSINYLHNIFSPLNSQLAHYSGV